MGFGITRRVLIQKGPNGLGFSVKGGSDVGMPLIVSRVEAGGGAVGMLKMGMEVSAVNGISLEGLPHFAAVEVLRRTRSPVILFVRNPTPDTYAMLENYPTIKADMSPLALPPGSGGSPEYPGTFYRENQLEEYHNQNEELYDLRTVKKFIKEITHFPKEIFARKLAWKFPPLALGKFHKWLLAKLERFDCEAPKTPANYVFDAYSQSLYLSRSIYDLVNLIRTLLIMEKNQAIAAPPPAVAPVEFNNPAVMASFLAELADIRTQLARARQQQDPEQVQTQITRQEAEIRVLREQLLRYEAKIAELTANNHFTTKDSDLSSFFRESLKKIKLKTMKRKASLTFDKPRHLAEYRPIDNERKSETLPLPTKSREPYEISGNLHAENTYVTSNTNLTATSSVRSNPGSSTPIKPKRSKVRFPTSPSPEHNEIVIKVGEQVSAITQKSESPDEVLLSRGTRDRAISSDDDDDYVQMHSALSRDSTLERSRDSKAVTAHDTRVDKSDDVCYRSVAPTEDTVIRRVSSDHRSSVDSKGSVDSVKMKYKHKIMISSDSHDSDYIQMNDKKALYDDNDDDNDSDSDEDADYVKFDQISRNSSRGSYDDRMMGIVNTSDEFSQFDQSYSGDGKYSGMSNTLPRSLSPAMIVTNQQPGKFDHASSCSTIKSGMALLEERQINAVQVKQIGQDIESILSDVEVLSKMEKALQKPPTLPPNTPYKFNTSGVRGLSPSTTSQLGSMVRSHEVPIYAKVERVTPPTSRPFSFGESSNSSYISNDDESRHDVCSSATTATATTNPAHPHNASTSSTTGPAASSIQPSRAVVRKASLTSNGSSIEQKSDYSSDRPCSYNTSHTTASTEMSHSYDRDSHVSSDLTGDDVSNPDRTSFQYDNVFATPAGITSSGVPIGISVTPCMESLPSCDGNTDSPDVNLDSCINQEVGKDFFKQRDSRGKDKTDKLSFKRILSFGKGKKKAPGPLLSRSLSPSRRNSTASVSSQSSRTLSHRPDVANHSRDSMSRDSGSCTSKNSTSTADSISIKSGTKFDTPLFLSHGLERQNSEENDYYLPEDARGDDFPDSNEPARVGSIYSTSSSQRRGFYHDQGVEIDFDKIPVKDEQAIDMDNEKIIDLDGGIIEDPKELSVLRGDNAATVAPPDKKDRLSKAAAELQIDDNRIRLLSEVEKAEVENDTPGYPEAYTCNGSDKKDADNTDSECQKDNDSTKTDNGTVILRCNSHSPTFSEIDVLLGDISKDLDNLTF